MKLSLFGYGVLFFISACRENSASDGKLFSKLPADTTGIYFNNDLKPDFNLNILEFDYFYNGGGIAAADFNNDGLTDLYFTGNQVSSLLYLNNGNFSFTDVTKVAGVETVNWATGIAVGDVNMDGWQDLFVCYSAAKEGTKRNHQLFINQGLNKENIPVFKDEAVKYGLADTSYSSTALFLDYDLDGDLDLYVATHDRSKINPNYPSIKKNDGKERSTDKLFRNDIKDGKIYFTDVSKQAGILHEGYSLSASVADFNNDGWPDIYVSNDFVYDDILYLNNKNGSFTESIHDAISHTSRFSMGSDVGDFNNDGLPDIITVDMLPDDNERQKMMNIGINNDLFNLSLLNGYLPQYSRNSLQLNNGLDTQGKLSFSEIGQFSGVYKTDWSWSVLFVDLDNDGWKDVFVTNGIPKDITNNDFITYRQQSIQGPYNYDDVKRRLLEELEKLPAVDKPNFVFSNNMDLTFSDKSEAWGLNTKGFSNGAVYADLDNDGDIDLVTNNLNGPASVYRNQSEKSVKNNFLRFQLNGRYANNSKVILYNHGVKQFGEYTNSHGFQSSQEQFLHFGIGKNITIDSVEIIWLNGKRQWLKDVAANQVIKLTNSDSANYADSTKRKPAISEPIFRNITSITGLDYFHKENEFEDFDFEPLLPHRFSRNGPFTAVADVDKNGYDDFWIGGPAKISGQIFLQQANGRFLSKVMPDPGYEDMGGVFFDADGDGDEDLYIVSGGCEYNANSAPYQDRLYINNGKGEFSLKVGAIPTETASGSCVISSDFDKDGDLDLFVGGSVQPGSYPFPSESMVLQNDGHGTFTNVTKAICSKLQNIGLVTDALWSDFDNDGWSDLIITGEWMPVTLFKNNKGKFEQVIGGNDLNSQTGWWFSIAGADFDKDGDQDYIVGNLGQNNKYNADKDHPLSVYAKDFDGNGRIESILSYFLEGKEYPVLDRDQIVSALPSIKKRFNTYSSYASQTFPEIFPSVELNGALVLQARNFSSSYLENLGNGQFLIRPLPAQAQFSAVQSIYIGDFDLDNNPDVLLGGNFYSPDFMTGRYDASIGLVLKGDGKGHFQPVSTLSSGIHFKGEVRSISEIIYGKEKAILVASNSNPLEVYRLKR